MGWDTDCLSRTVARLREQLAEVVRDCDGFRAERDAAMDNAIVARAALAAKDAALRELLDVADLKAFDLKRWHAAIEVARLAVTPREPRPFLEAIAAGLREKAASEDRHESGATALSLPTAPPEEKDNG